VPRANRAGTVYATQEWRRVRRTILERDGHACRLCGARDRLTVQHRVPYRVAPHLALDPGNLVTLCARCHGRQDGGRRYGRKPRRIGD